MHYIPKIGKFSSWRSLFTSREGLRVEVWVGDKKAPALMTIGESGVACFGRSEPQFREAHGTLSCEICHILGVIKVLKGNILCDF